MQQHVWSLTSPEQHITLLLVIHLQLELISDLLLTYKTETRTARVHPESFIQVCTLSVKDTWCSHLSVAQSY